MLAALVQAWGLLIHWNLGFETAPVIFDGRNYVKKPIDHSIVEFQRISGLKPYSV